MKFKGFLTKRTIIQIGAALVILAATAFVVFSSRAPKEDTFTVTAEDFVQEVSVSGKVVPAQVVDLVFSQSGRVSGVYADVGDTVARGDVLASIENADARAEVAQKEAAYEAALARLEALRAGTRPEKVAVTESQVASARAALSDAIRSAYTSADDALHNRVDQFFYNSHTQQPKLAFVLSGQLQIDVEWNRFLAEETLKRTGARTDALTLENVEAHVAQTAKDLGELRAFLSLAAEAVSALEPSSDMPQTTIDSYQTHVATARTNVQSATQSFTSAATALETAKKNLVLDEAGAIQEDIAEQEARVAIAKADLDSARARYQKTLVVAPFSGVITVMNAKTGGSASAATSLISLMSSDTLQIESFMPEINTPYIEVGDEAVVTLDAYGDTPFAAEVVALDPAETVRDGISTYRAVLRFNEKDPRVRSGMTANVRITTEEKENVLAAPKGVLEKRGGESYVHVKEGDEYAERLVQTGSVSSLGMVEILSGLEAGDVLLLDPEAR